MEILIDLNNVDAEEVNDKPSHLGGIIKLAGTSSETKDEEKGSRGPPDPDFVHGYKKSRFLGEGGGKGP